MANNAIDPTLLSPFAVSHIRDLVALRHEPSMLNRLQILNLWPWLIAASFFILATIYSIVTPIFEAPDELWHYPFVWHVARTWQLPVQDPNAPQLWQQEGSQPPLYYFMAALLTAPVAADDLPGLIYRNPHADIGVVSPDGNANIVVHTDREGWPWRGAVLAVHLARFFSVILGAGTVLAVYALADTLWPDHPSFAATAMVFVAFNPMFIFMSGAVNNDNLIIFLASLTMWRLVSLVVQSPGPRGDAKDPSWRHFVTLGVIVGAAALAKVSGLGLVGVTGLTVLVWGLQRRSRRIAIFGNIIITGVAAVIAGWWYWRNIRLYGDWSGTEIMIAMMGPRPITPTLTQFWAELSGLVRSFWGLFGYFSVPMPSFIYTGLNVVLIIGLAGFLLACLPTNRVKKLPQYLPQVWPILVIWLLVLGAGFVQWTLRTPATQGRLLFPALGVLAVFWATGWLAWVPTRWQAGPGLGLFLLAVWVPWGVIAPAYARPATVAALPAAAQSLTATFGDSIRLLGYQVEDQSFQPGQTAFLTLYWQGIDPIDTDYTLFIHLLDDNDLILAQRDVYHGPGLFPTSQWIAGDIFADRYALSLPNTTFAPAQASFAVGLYDANNSSRLLTATGQDNVRFGQIEIQSRQTGDISNPQQLHFEEGIVLAGYALDRRRATAGDTLTLTLYWQAKDTPSANYKVFVHLTNDNDLRVAQHDSDPQNGAAPTGSWMPGQIITDDHPLQINLEAQPGAYRFIVGLYQAETGRRLRLLRDGPASVQADSVILSGVRITQ